MSATATYIERVVSERIGHSDWGEVRASGEHHSFALTVESFEVVERLPEILDAARSCIAQLRADYMGSFAIHLKVRPPIPSVSASHSAALSQAEDIELPKDPDESAYDFDLTGDDSGDGDIAVETDPDPPQSLFEDDEAHPLADNYRLAGATLLDEVWFYSHSRGIAVHLMQREPDVEIPDEPKPQSAPPPP